MNDEPAAYMTAALSSLGITCQSLVVSKYEPMVFGNLLASVDTNMGNLKIAHDRGFYIQAYRWQDDAPSFEQITTTLEQYKKAATDER